MNLSRTRSLSNLLAVSAAVAAASSVASTFGGCALNPSKVKRSYAYPENLKMEFTNLPKVLITDVDVELITDNLKYEHSRVISIIYEYLKQDENIDEINEFQDWTNEFLGQLIFVYCKTVVNDMLAVKDLFFSNPRYQSVINDIDTLTDSFNTLAEKKILRLISAPETTNSYPISAEGINFLKELTRLIQRADLLNTKIKQFQVTQK